MQDDTTQPPPTSCCAGKVRDFHGPVFNNPGVHPKVYLIFWGSGWSSASNPSRSKIETKIQTMVNSSSKYFDALSQYRGVMKPVLGGSITNTTYAVPSGDVGVFQPGDVVKDSIAHGTVPNPDTTKNTDILGNTFDRTNIFCVMVPPNKDIPGYGGMHTSATTTAGTRFAWCAIMHNAAQSQNGNLPDPNDHLQNFTQAFSHELVDLLTDPIPNSGVEGSNGFGYVGGDCPFGNPNLCEIAQTVCGNRQLLYNNVCLESYWSDKDGKCVLPGVDSNITATSCMAGCHWDSTQGMCVRDSTGCIC